MDPLPPRHADRPRPPLPEGIGALPRTAVRIDTDGRIRDAGATAAAMLGFRPQELQGRSLRDLAVEEWRAAADVAVARMRFGAVDQFELALRGRSGRRTLVEMTVGAGGAGGEALVFWVERRLRLVADAEEIRRAQRATYAVLTRWDAQRRRTAATLDSEIAPIVAAAKYAAEEGLRQAQNAGWDVAAPLRESIGRLRDVLIGLRRLSETLHPRHLEDLGLADAVSAECRAAEGSAPGLQLSCAVTVPEDRIPALRSTDLIRIVEELLDNVVRHAHARHAHLRLQADRDGVSLTLEDDGIGFDAPAAEAAFGTSAAGGVGLGLVRARAQATGGRTTVQSQRNGGTTVRIVWPLPEGSG